MARGLSKHIAIKYHKIQEWVIAKEIVPTYMSTTEMVADVSTKPIVSAQFEYFPTKSFCRKILISRIEMPQNCALETKKN